MRTGERSQGGAEGRGVSGGARWWEGRRKGSSRKHECRRQIELECVYEIYEDAIGIKSWSDRKEEIEAMESHSRLKPHIAAPR